MDVVLLSRWQFAVTCMFHFIFVPLTLGLSVLVAWMETKYVRTGDEMWLRMTKFWGKLFLINFALGVVTGITMEFQFGMNWAEYSRYVGDIFGAPLAIEATVTFFLESVFIGLWIFGWDKISKKTHALWILIANGWMQNPVGYVLRNGRAEMTDFVAIITNKYAMIKFVHQLTSGYTVAAFFIMGIAAWHLLRNQNTEFFKRSFSLAAKFGLAALIVVLVSGDFHAVEIATVQPSKFAAMESVWETQHGAPMCLVVVPGAEADGCNKFEAFKIPGLLSFMAFHDVNAKVKGLKDFPPDERPPVWPVFLSFRLMIGLGALFVVLALVGVWLSYRDKLQSYPFFLKVMVFAIPLPYLVNQLGWIVAELGRQPWAVYGVLKTADSVSKAVSAGQVAGSLLGFTLLYGFLGVVDIYLLAKHARKGPDTPALSQSTDY
jgi:cytochrome d ubiquinol oxidase subunit I